MPRHREVPRGPSDEPATLDPPQCREVAEELRGVAETFAEVPDDGRYGPYPPDARPLARPELTRIDPVPVTEFAEIADKLWHRPPRAGGDRTRTVQFERSLADGGRVANAA